MESPLNDAIVSVLKSCQLNPTYQDEQRDLQPHLEAIVGETLDAKFPKQFELVRSIGIGSPKPSIKLFGTSFWPDLEIRQPGGEPVLGIEVKYARTSKEVSKAIAESLGQAVIYRLRYATTIAFVLCRDRRIPAADELQNRFNAQLLQHGIRLIVRSAGADSAAEQAARADR
jgi:hypothetical protein